MPKIGIAEQLTPVELLNPATDAGGRTSAYVLLGTAQRATIVFHVGQGSASTILISILQATDEEGTSSKVITVNVPIWLNIDTSVNDQFVRQTDAVNFTTDTGTKNKIVIFQVDPEYLDQVNGFKSIAISTGASSASNLTAAVVHLEQRYMQPNPPGAVDL